MLYTETWSWPKCGNCGAWNWPWRYQKVLLELNPAECSHHAIIGERLKVRDDRTAYLVDYVHVTRCSRCPLDIVHHIDHAHFAAIER